VTEIRRFYDSLFERYGDLRWWPGETPFEIMLGAILTQNTNWVNVEKALSNLAKLGLLSPHELLNADDEVIREAIRPSGYFNQKTLKLRRFMDWLNYKTECSIDALSMFPTEELRYDLLSIRGIGPETADDILLYALDRPVFVVDAYTFRIAYRHGWIPQNIDYDGLAEIFRASIEYDISIYKNYHAMIVETGKNFCRKKAPICAVCPGKSHLPESGPYE